MDSGAHFDAKAEADAFFAAAGVPTTYLHTTFYWDNPLSGVGPQRDSGGRLGRDAWRSRPPPPGR